MDRLWQHNPPQWTQPHPGYTTIKHVIRQVGQWDGSRPPASNAGLWQHVHPVIAMRIAALVASASTPAVATFAMSGTVTDHLIEELNCLLMTCEPEQVAELRALLGYVRAIDPSPERRSAHSGQ